MSESKARVSLGSALRTQEFRRIVLLAVRTAARSQGIRLRPEEIEDIAQETLLRLWSRASAIQPGDQRAYVSRATKNILIDLIRSKRSAKRDGGEAGGSEILESWPSTDPSPEELLLGKEALAQRLAVCRKALPHELAELVLFVCGAELSSKEAAAILGISAAVVDSLVHRARHRLRRATGLVIQRRRMSSRNRDGRGGERC